MRLIRDDGSSIEIDRHELWGSRQNLVVNLGHIYLGELTTSIDFSPDDDFGNA